MTKSCIHRLTENFKYGQSFTLKQIARKLKLLQIGNPARKTYFWPKYCADAENAHAENVHAENAHAENVHAENVHAETEYNLKT